MAKDEISLEKSREQREQLLKMFNGKIPESIIKHDKLDSAIDFICSGKGINSRSTKYLEKTKNLLNNKINPKLAKIFGHTPGGSKSGANFLKKRKQKLYLEGKDKNQMEVFCGSGKSGKNVLSLFSQNVGRKIINFYTNKKDIIIDPFAGHNSRMQLCFEVERNYYGVDICHEFMVMNEKIKDSLINNNRFVNSNTIIELFEGDSRKLPFEDCCGDFTITSPPYWDMEYYGDEKEQLGFSNTYKSFLDNLELVMKENYRVLKQGSFCVWFVNDFRKKGKFYNYHGDIIKRMENVGFIQHDILIIDLGSSLQSIFASQAFKNKILPKRHEYGLVFKKGK